MYSFDEASISDLHKDACGHRPGGIFWSEWESASDDRKQEIWDLLCDSLDVEMDREAQAEAAALESWENDVDAMRVHTLSLQQAQRWALEAELERCDIDPSRDQDWAGYLCFQLGMSYDMAVTFRKIWERG